MLIDVTNPFLDWIFPVRCFVCGDDTKNIKLCEDCLDFCHSNSNPAFFSDKGYGFLFYYEMSIKSLIRSAKFYKNLPAAHLLKNIAEAQLSQSPLLPEMASFAPDAVTYIPTHFINRVQRRIELPFLFAQIVADRLNVPILVLLKRNGYKNRQVLHKSKSDRMAAIKGAFSLKTTKQTYDRLLIVDDVVTTGATFLESAKVLKNICPEIKCLALAKTP